MANQVTITFEGPLDSPNPNFTIHNGTTSATIYCVGLSGKTAQFPITWDRIGDCEGTAKLTGTDGVEIKTVQLFQVLDALEKTAKEGDALGLNLSLTKVVVSQKVKKTE